MFDNIQIENGYGHRIVIETKNNKPNNYYVQSVKLNGEPLKENSVPLSTLKKGATLEFVMGDQPNRNLFKTE